ncbi:Oxysterol-binding protein-like protein 1 [Elaphomyces granulatus]
MTERAEPPSPSLNGLDKINNDESSKLRTFLSILRRFVGVPDIAFVRFSLPAQLLEPTPNLEYWNYLDRPETFLSIGKSDDPLGRMLETRELIERQKYIKCKPCKPYNSTLGEFFRCNWEVEDATPSIDLAGPREVKISYLTEQTSHHPPVSAFYIHCPQTSINAKFTGTSIRVNPGQHTLGIFNDEYQLTHPAAHLGGLLRGSLSITVTDSCYMTCPKTRIKVILQYLEDGWVGCGNTTKMKSVPRGDILAKIHGSWHQHETEPRLLIDVAPLLPVAKIAPPEQYQLPNESRRFWSQVTTAILEKQYGQATKFKHEIEDRQRIFESSWLERNSIATKEFRPRLTNGKVVSSSSWGLSSRSKSFFPILPAKILAASAD